MARQANTKKNTSKKLKVINNFIHLHKGISVFALVSAFILLSFGIVKYSSYLNKFSDKDYVAMESKVEEVFENIGADSVDKYKSCSYEAPEKYSSVKLYCSVQMAAYLTYDSDSRAIEAAKNLEKEVRKTGSTISDIPTFYDNPSDAMTGIVVTFAPPLPHKQCNFTIASGERAKRIADFLPERSEDNLIAVVFDCSAESREEYFPVTYRQGS